MRRLRSGADTSLGAPGLGEGIRADDRAEGNSVALKTKRVRIGRLEIQVDEAGHGDRPLVLLHGLTGHRRDFENVLPELARHGLVLAPDIRGHGGSHPPAAARGYDVETLVADLLGLLDGLGIERCDLLGHSFGGMIALRFCLAHPERVASLILMSSSCEAPDNLTRETFEKAGGYARSKGMAKLQSRLEELGRADEAPLPPNASDELRDWRARYWEHHRLRHRDLDPEAYRDLGVAMTDQVPVTSRLGEIECPSLVIIGREDVDFVRGARLLAKGLHDVTVEKLPGVEHHPHQEAQSRFLEILAKFLERVRS
jgi:pimeloyl-ACP methyl ester carboxylesterase